jgi:hypothetical protein
VNNPTIYVTAKIEILYTTDVAYENPQRGAIIALGPIVLS